jgi:hypothetical protein
VDASATASTLSIPDCVWDPQDAARVLADPDSSPELRDAALLVVVLAYRADKRWSELLLKVLQPEMARRLNKRLRPRPPVISDADLRFQFTLEVLEAAAFMPMPADARHVDRRVVRRAGMVVWRWLRDELHYQEAIEPLPNEDDDEEDEEDEQ